MAECPPTAGLINSLDPASPTDPDRVFCADDWFRFVQAVLKTNQFPKSEDGSNNGWDIALTVKASEVNSLAGIGSAQTVEQRLATLEAGYAKFPGGNTVFLGFHNGVSAITGWRQTLTDLADNRMLRVVNVASVSGGGRDDPLVDDKVPAHTHDFNTNTTGSHIHSVDTFNVAGSASSVTLSGTTNPGFDSDVVNAAGDHSHSGTTEVNPAPTNHEPRYLDFILASKE